MVWGLALGSVALVSLLSLSGAATLVLGRARLRAVTSALVAFALGTLMGDVSLHLLPAALRDVGASRERVLELVMAGFFTFFALEKLIRHEHGPLEHAHANDVAPVREIAVVNLVGDALHNFVDGALIGASWLASPTLGISTTIAIAMHELPQELGDFGILVHSGLGVRRALLLNLASATVAVAGTVAALVVGAELGQALVRLLIPITAGAFLYLAGANLVPELQRERAPGTSVLQAIAIALGIGIMAALTCIE